MMYYVVMVMRHWDAIEVEINFPFPPMTMKSPDGESIGYLAVFETREQAEKSYPGAKISIVKLAE